MNPKVKELRQQRAALVSEMHDLTEKSSFPAEAQKRWNELDVQQKALDAQIRAIESTETLSAEMREVKAPPQAQPGAENLGNRQTATTPEEMSKRIRERLESPEYRGAFMEWARRGDAKMSRANFDILEGVTAEARTYTGLQTPTSGDGGGYVVPIGFQRELEIKMKAYGRMRDNCRILTTSTGNTLDWPTMDDTGNTGEFVGENNAVSQLNPTFGQVQFGSYLASSKQVLISVQLLQDSAFDLEGELSLAFAIRLGRILNNKYTLGNGSGVPRGLVYAIQNDAAPNTVNAVGSNSNDGISGNTEANSIGSDDLDNLISAVDPAYRTNAKFMMNWKTIDFLRKVKDKYGRPLWVASLAVGEPDRIFGYPFDWNSDMDTVAAGKYPVLFGDFTKYLIRDVGGVTVVRYNELNSRANLAAMPGHEISSDGLEPCDGNEAQAEEFVVVVLLQRERLSEETPLAGDAIVCSHGNWNHEKPAEMTGSFRAARNGNNWLHAEPPSRISSFPAYRWPKAAASSLLAPVQPAVLTKPRGAEYISAPQCLSSLAA